MCYTVILLYCTVHTTAVLSVFARAGDWEGSMKVCTVYILHTLHTLYILHEYSVQHVHVYCHNRVVIESLHVLFCCLVIDVLHVVHNAMSAYMLVCCELAYTCLRCMK
jgi:hypothetical protein